MNIMDATIEDLDAILSLQKIAYKSEAEIHNDYSIPPLHQTIDDIKSEFGKQLFLKVGKVKKIIGSVRAYAEGDTCYIGKLIVDPQYQNKGIGKKLMYEIESRFNNVKRYELFTGFKSEKNLYLYEKLGYIPFKREKVSDKLVLIYLHKINNT